MAPLKELEEILNLKPKQVRKLYGEYVNPGLARLLFRYSFDRHFVKAQGIHLWDEKGNRYWDFLGGYGALNFGHNPDFILQDIERVKQFPNMLQAGLSEFAAALSYNLCQLSPGDLKITYFGNSGTEAVEAALKTVRAATGRAGLLYCQAAYHGKTFGSLSVTGNEKYKAPFYPLLSPTKAVPFGHLELLESELKKEIYAGFIVEPIQGEAGIILPPDGYLKAARELCKTYQTLFIADEIQTGLGRTGKLFASEWYELEPDLMTLAKSLGGGIMPIGACLMRKEIWEKGFGGEEKCTLHSSTFGGNTWAMTAGISALKFLVAEKLAEKAGVLGEYCLSLLKENLLPHPLIKEIRGKGLMIGIEFSSPPEWKDKLEGKMASLVAGELLNKYNILTAYTLNNPDVLRIEPALIIEKADIDRLVQSLADMLKTRFALTKLLLKTTARLVKSYLG